MEKRDALTKTLAILGVILVWFPILAPILLTVVFLFTRGQFRFDFLMPAELFAFALAGGLLLTWASYRAGSYRRWIISCLAIAVGALFGAQGLAVVTGLADGRIPAKGFWFAVVLSLLAVYIVALIFLGFGGAWLVKDIFKKPKN